MTDQFDQLVIEYYAEDREEADELPKMTPSGAIQIAIFDLCQKRGEWGQRDDPNGVLPWIIERIACLEQAQRELTELREIKQALAVLKGML
jgi:hypothetical protein